METTKIVFKTPEEGLNALIELYTSSEVTGGDFIDALINEDAFDASIPEAVLQEALIKFRTWDWDGGNQSIQIQFYWNDDPEKNIEVRDAMIGTNEDEDDNDDEVFFWFEDEASIFGDGEDFTVVSYVIDSQTVKNLKI